MMMDGNGIMGMMIFMFLFGLLSIVLVVLIVVAVVKWLWGSKMPLSASDRENALEILRKRYAKGEIGRDEFENIRRDIEK
jgi:putative membrane protein